MKPEVLAPLLVGLVAAVVSAAPLVAARRRRAVDVVTTLLVLVLLVPALATSNPVVGYGLLAGIAAARAVAAWPRTKTGAVGLGIAALATGAAALALARGAPQTAFVASLLAIALRSGVWPLHPTVAALTDRAPRLQTQQLGTTLALVWMHLRFVDHIPLAVELAPLLVRLGAGATLIAALISLVGRDVRDWLRSSMVMHAGLLFTAVGAAGSGHYTAALLEAITLALALGGMGIVVAGLEERCGRVALTGLGGRARSLPRLCAAFAVFGAAGVGMPATAGFIADDFLLHALWEQSVAGSIAVVFGTALLAVATLGCWSKVFLGPPVKTLAADLCPRERLALVLLLLALILIGLMPQLLLTPVTAVLEPAALPPH
jgi:NADH-quinone oxidoreductase subunit M